MLTLSSGRKLGPYGSRTDEERAFDFAVKSIRYVRATTHDDRPLFVDNIYYSKFRIAITSNQFKAAV